MRRIIPLVLAASLGCGSDATMQPPAGRMVGTWNLQTINGQPLPYADPQASGYKFETLSNTVTMDSRGFYRSRGQYRVTTNGRPATYATTDSGTYSLNEPQLVVVSMATGESQVGTVSGKTLTFIAPGHTFVLMKK
jgi:Lipocalin-like domain